MFRLGGSRGGRGGGLLASLVLLGVVGCGALACARRDPWPPSWLLVIPTDSTRLMVSLQPARSGPPLLAVGDTLRLSLDEEHCRADVCAGSVRYPIPRLGWRSSRPEVASVDSTGLLTGRRRGTTTVSVPWGARRLKRPFTVLPPVAAIRWQPVSAIVRVGDTLFLEAVAYDSAGRRVANIPVAYTRWVEGRAGYPVARRSKAPRYRLVPDSLGRFRVFAVLAHRVDSLEIRGIP